MAKNEDSPATDTVGAEAQAMGGPEPDPGRILRTAKRFEDAPRPAADGPEPPPGRIFRFLFRWLQRLFGREPART